MSIVVIGLIVVLFANAAVSFFIAFFWQAKVIFIIFDKSDWNIPFSHGNASGGENSSRDTFRRFVAGEIFPELRRKWSRAIAYVAISYTVLFLVAGLLLLSVPEYLK